MRSSTGMKRRETVPKPIHCVERDGKFYFRLWSTITDSYHTAETDDPDELKELLWREYVLNLKEQFEDQFASRINRAKQRGTSCRISSPRRIPITLTSSPTGNWSRSS